MERTTAGVESVESGVALERERNSRDSKMAAEIMRG
jgi:hypothetical protein